MNIPGKFVQRPYREDTYGLLYVLKDKATGNPIDIANVYDVVQYRVFFAGKEDDPLIDFKIGEGLTISDTNKLVGQYTPAQTIEMWNKVLYYELRVEFGDEEETLVADRVLVQNAQNSSGQNDSVLELNIDLVTNEVTIELGDSAAIAVQASGEAVEAKDIAVQKASEAGTSEQNAAESASDSELQAQSTGPFTDSEGSDFDNGAKGYRNQTQVLHDQTETISIEDALVLKVKTDNTGTSNDNQFTFPTGDFGSPDYDVNWGDGSITRGHTGAATHTYDEAGTYILRIVGNVAHFGFNNGGDKNKLLEVMNWGAIRDYARFYYTFFGCENMQITANDVPNLNNLEIPALFRVFRNATLFNQDISSWNVSEITSISQIFDGASSFNQDISSWDVSSVVTYFRCFFNASSFNQDLQDWPLSPTAVNLSDLFGGSGMSVENYNKWLISRANLVDAQGAPYNVDMSGQSGMQYNDTVYAEFSGEAYEDAVSARAFLVGETAQWTITGDTDAS